MTIAIGVAVICFLASAAAFLFGFVTEYRQTQRMRRGEPVSLVGTLPWAVAAAIFLSFGLLSLPIPWWNAPIGFVIGVVVFGNSIIRASRNHKPN